MCLGGSCPSTFALWGMKDSDCLWITAESTRPPDSVKVHYEPLVCFLEKLSINSAVTVCSLLQMLSVQMYNLRQEKKITRCLHNQIETAFALTIRLLFAVPDLTLGLILMLGYCLNYHRLNIFIFCLLLDFLHSQPFWIWLKLDWFMMLFKMLVCVVLWRCRELSSFIGKFHWLFPC